MNWKGRDAAPKLSVYAHSNAQDGHFVLFKTSVARRIVSALEHARQMGSRPLEWRQEMMR